MLNDLNKALTALQQGGIILYPTDTIWGIGCDATNEKAVKKIYRIKEREDSKSMLILVDGIEKISHYIETVPAKARELIEISDSPLTIIYPGAKNLAKNLIAEDGSVGIRIVKDEFCQKLLKQFEKPLVSTSANKAGQPPPASFSDIDKKIIESVDYSINWRQDDPIPGRPSSIIKLGIHDEIEIIRK